MITDYFTVKNEKESLSTKVVRLKRKKGKIVQGCDVYIGRECFRGGWELRKSKWSNPFSVKSCGSNEKACKKYKEYILKNPDLINSLYELEGKVLGCWCKPNSCHGDVLVELINNIKKKNISPPNK